jgi:circadian clock protein KaiC
VERITTGVPGLDTLLRGGLLRGGIYMVMGRPGSGKTTLGNQLCFHHARGGGQAVYATLLTESHGRMLALLETFNFYDPSVVGSSVHYLSAYSHLEKGGLSGMLEVLKTSLRRLGATLLILDGVPTAGAVARSDLELKKFVHELQVIVELVGATCVMLTGASHPDAHHAERTMVDGLLLLTSAGVDLRTVRELEVVKHRGSEQLAGRHLYRITREGMRVHPRLEALGLLGGRGPAATTRRRSLGIPGLDLVLGGGPRAGSVTLVKGPAGIGKTLIGASFLAAGEPDERGLFFGMSEDPGRLVEKAAGVGVPLRAAVDGGRVELVWRPDAEELADAHAEHLLEAVRARRVERLVIDGLGGLMSTLVYPGRAAAFFAALFHELRALGVAVLLTMEARDLAGDEPPLPVSGVSSLVDNILHLRFVEVDARTRRFVCAVKASDRPQDSELHELTIGPRGLEVLAAGSARAALSGVLRTSAAAGTVPRPPEGPDCDEREGSAADPGASG